MASNDDLDEIDLDEEEEEEENNDENDNNSRESGEDKEVEPREQDGKATEADNSQEHGEKDQEKNNAGGNENGGDAAATAEESTTAAAATTKGSTKKTKKSQALRQQLRSLKLRMNQSRQLNQQEVQREAQEQFSSTLSKSQKKKAAALGMAKEDQPSKVDGEGVDDEEMTESASRVIRHARHRANKAHLNEFEVNDYHNPEGQYRNYQRSLQSLPPTAAANSKRSAGAQNDNDEEDQDEEQDAAFDPLQATLQDYNDLDNSNNAPKKRTTELSAERRGAQRLAAELHRRAAKSKKKRQRLELDAEDVNHVNQRNKRFNEKIGRHYDKHTAEIRQNLERGTAL